MIQLGARRGSTERRVQDLNMEKHDCWCVCVSVCVSVCERRRQRGSSKTHVGFFNPKVTVNVKELWVTLYIRVSLVSNVQQ